MLFWDCLITWFMVYTCLHCQLCCNVCVFICQVFMCFENICLFSFLVLTASCSQYVCVFGIIFCESRMVVDCFQLTQILPLSTWERRLRLEVQMKAFCMKYSNQSINLILFILQPCVWIKSHTDSRVRLLELASCSTLLVTFLWPHLDKCRLD